MCHRKGAATAAVRLSSLFLSLLSLTLRRPYSATPISPPRANIYWSPSKASFRALSLFARFISPFLVKTLKKTDVVLPWHHWGTRSCSMRLFPVFSRGRVPPDSPRWKLTPRLFILESSSPVSHENVDRDRKEFNETWERNGKYNIFIAWIQG